jgi:transcriptional regulator with PAS, ATPase and Fis domain
MVVMTEEKDIQIKHLPATIKNKGYSGVYFVASESLSLKSALEQIEKDLITKALNKYGSTRKAAKALMVDQSTIVRKARKYAYALREEQVKINC